MDNINFINKNLGRMELETRQTLSPKKVSIRVKVASVKSVDSRRVQAASSSKIINKSNYTGTGKVFFDSYVLPFKKCRTPEELENYANKKNNVRLQAVIGLQRMTTLLSPYFKKAAKASVYSKLQWTDVALVSQLRKFEQELGHPLSVVMLSRIQESIAGIFIEEFNKGESMLLSEKEMLLDLAKRNLMNTKDYPDLDRKNDIVDNIVEFLNKIIHSVGEGEVTLEMFVKQLTHLRLQDSMVKFIDIGLQQLNSLKILILSGNSIKELPLHYLPQSLHVLELNNNFICRVLVGPQKPPPLLFLGLGCNCFCDDSSIEGLKEIPTLSILDLSDNNIIEMEKILSQLKDLPQLMSISLRGNPCSTMINYKDSVKKILPMISLLDGKDLIIKSSQEKLRKLRGSESKSFLFPILDYQAELRIVVFRLAGFPKPTPKKNIKKFFQFEVELPLLDNKLLVKEKCQLIFELLKRCGMVPDPNLINEMIIHKKLPEEEEGGKEEEAGEEQEEEGGVITKFENRKTALQTISAMKINKKKEEWEIAYDEFLSEDKPIRGAQSHVSEKIQWASVMKPSSPIVALPVELNNLVLLRNTLRSLVVIRLYYKEEGVKTGTDYRKLVAKICVPAEVPLWSDEYSYYEWNAKEPKRARLNNEVPNMKFGTGIKGKQNIIQYILNLIS